MKQECLLPGTDAITKNTLEWSIYHGKQLVRYKDANGSVHRCLTADYAEAEQAFNNWLEDMREQAQESYGRRKYGKERD